MQRYYFCNPKLMSYFMPKKIHQTAILDHFKDKNLEQDVYPVMNTLKSLNVPKPKINQIFNLYPAVLSLEQIENPQKDYMDVIKFNKIMSDYCRKTEIRSILIKFPEILLIDQKDFKFNLQQLREKLGATKQKLGVLIRKYPKIVFVRFANTLKMIDFYNNWLNIDKQELLSLMTKKNRPWMCSVDQQQLKLAIDLMYHYLLSQEEVKDLFLANPRVAFLNREMVNQWYYFFQKVGFTQQERNALFVKYPQFLSISPIELLPKYIATLKFYKLGLYKDLKDILTNYPQIFLKSLNSLQLKLKFLGVFGKKLNKRDIKEILVENYNSNIRPRGQILTQRGFRYQLKYFKMSNKEFIEEVGITEKELKDKIRERKVNEEKDKFKNPLNNILM